MSTPPRRPGTRTLRLLPLGRFFGVPIFLAPSWVLIAGFLTLAYGPIVDDAVVGIDAGTSYAVALAYSVLFAGCVLAHELGHTAVALALRQPVRRVVIFFLGGVSELGRDARRPREEFLVSIAGPLVSALLVALTGAALPLLPDHSIAGVLVELLFWSNVVVVVFNLLPGLPLDGGRVLRSVVWAASHSRLTATRVGAMTGRGVAVLVAISGIVTAQQTTLGLGAAVLSLLLAAYLWLAAGQEQRAAAILDRVPTVDVERLLRPGLLVPSDVTVAEALQRIWSGTARGLVLTDGGGRPIAIVDEAKVMSLPAEQRPWTAVRDLARPLEDGMVLPRGLSGQELLDAVRRTPATEYLVVDDQGAPAGILATADLAAVLTGTSAAPAARMPGAA